MFYDALKHDLQVLTLIGQPDGMGGRISSYSKKGFEGYIADISSVRTEEAERPTASNSYVLFYEEAQPTIRFGSIIQEDNKTFKVVSQPTKCPAGNLKRFWQAQLQEWRLP